MDNKQHLNQTKNPVFQSKSQLNDCAHSHTQFTTKETDQIEHLTSLLQQLETDEANVDAIVYEIYNDYSSSPNNKIHDYFIRILPYQCFISIFVQSTNLFTKIFALGSIADCIESDTFDYDSNISEELILNVLGFLSSSNESVSSIENEEEKKTANEMIIKTCCLFFTNLFKKKSKDQLQELFNFLLGNNIFDILFQIPISFNVLELIDEASLFTFPNSSFVLVIIQHIAEIIKSLSVKDDEQLSIIEESLIILKDLLSSNGNLLNEDQVSTLDLSFISTFLSSEIPINITTQSLELLTVFPSIPQEILNNLINNIAEQELAPIIRLTCDIVTKFIDECASFLTPDFIEILAKKLHTFSIRVDESIIRCIIKCILHLEYFDNTDLLTELSNYITSKEIAPELFTLFGVILSSTNEELKTLILENSLIEETANEFSQLREENPELAEIAEGFLAFYDQTE